MGTDENILSLEALQRIYFMVVQNLKLARERQTKQKSFHPVKLKTEDMVMIKTHADGQFQPIYKGYYRIVSFKGNQVQVVPCEGGKPHFVHITDVKYVLPADSVITHIPTFNQFGRKTKLNLNPDVVPDLKWKLSDSLNTKTPIIPVKIEKVNTQTTQLDFEINFKLYSQRLIFYFKIGEESIIQEEMVMIIKFLIFSSLMNSNPEDDI